MVGLGTTMIGIFAASSRLDFAANRLEKTQVAVRRINDQIASTQKNLNRLMEQGKANTEDYTVQVGRLTTAFQDLKTKEEDVNLAQTALNDTQLLFATTIVNTGINSIFLMRSAFTGLSLSQIKATITGAAHSTQMAVGSGAMGSFAISTGFATGALLRFRTALLTAAPPLLIVAAAFAAYEGIIAPYIEKQTGANASLLKWVGAQFEAKDALDKTNPVLQKFKDALGETTEEQESLNDATKEFADLADPVRNSVQTQINGLRQLQSEVGITTAEWLNLQRAINNVRVSAGLPTGFSSPLITGASNSKLSPQATFARLSGQTGGAIAGSGGTTTGVRVSGPSVQFPSTASSVMTSVAKNNSQEITEALAISIFTGRKFDPNLSLVENAREMKARLPHLQTQLKRDLKSVEQQIAAGSLFTGVSGGTATFRIIEATVVEKIAELLNTRVGIIEQKNGISKVIIKNIVAGGTPQIQDSFLGKIAFLSNPAAFKSREIFDVGTQIGTIGFRAGSNPFFPTATNIGEVQSQLSKFPEGIQKIFSEILAAQLAGDNVKATKLTVVLEDIIGNIDPVTGIPRAKPSKGSSSSDIIRPKLDKSDTFFSTSAAELLNNAVEKKKQAESFFIDAANFRKLALTSSTRAGRIQQSRRADAAFDKGVKLALKGESLAKLASLMDFSFGTGFGGIGGQAIQFLRSKGVSFGQGSLAFRALGLSQLVEQGISGAAVPVPGRINVDFREFADPIGTISEQQIAGMVELNRSRAADNINFILTALGRGDAKIGTDGNVSFSEQVGGAARFALRNRQTLRRLRQEAKQRDAFMNSIGGARQIILNNANLSAQNFLALATGGISRGISTLGRSAASAVRRLGGIDPKRLDDLRFDILASFALHQEDPVLSAIVQGRPSQIFDPSRVNAAVTAFIGRSNALQNVSQNGGYGGGPIGANRFRNAKRQFAQQSIGRLGVFMARLVRGEPITIGEADNFASNILGEARLESTLATLGTTVSKEFKADNIDTRNEVLRLEALAYKIERDEASAIA